MIYMQNKNNYFLSSCTCVPFIINKFDIIIKLIFFNTVVLLKIIYIIVLKEHSFENIE